MAVKKGSTSTKNDRNADGRALAVKLLQKIERINDTCLQDVRKSRDLMAATLEKFRDLPASERFRFATILNDTIGSAYAGVMTNPAVYDQARHEVTYMRIGTRYLREVERIRDAKAREAPHA